MEDLSGLDWTTSTVPTISGKPPPFTHGSSYSNLRPTPPLSGNPTSTSIHLSRNDFKPTADPTSRSHNTTPANDSFANLVKFNASQSTKKISLQEQQKILQEQKANQGKNQGVQYKHRDADTSGQRDIWDILDNGRATPDRVAHPPPYAATDEYGGHKISKAINRPFAGIAQGSRLPVTRMSSRDEGDLLSAFDASAAVDSSSYLPAPLKHIINDDALNSRSGGDGESTTSIVMQGLDDTNETRIKEDDGDPFGLGVFESKGPVEHKRNGAHDDDDVLGLLGRPVSEFPPPELTSVPSSQSQKSTISGSNDHALAELVDMGFPPQKSREALAVTESGHDVQAAVSWLLNQAHDESKSKPQSERKLPSQSAQPKPQQPRKSRRRSNSPIDDVHLPIWMREQKRPDSTERRQESRSPATGEKDSAKYAAEIGNNLFKTANTLWKTGAKKLNQAVSELNSDSDSSQPKWMREPPVVSLGRKPREQPQVPEANGHGENSAMPRQRPLHNVKQPDVTDEALMLESGDNRPQARKSTGRSKSNGTTWSSDSSRDQSPAMGAEPHDIGMAQPRFMQKSRAPDPRARTSKQALEEQTAQAHISPARRKKVAPKPPSPNQDLLFDASRAPSTPLPSQDRLVAMPQAKYGTPKSRPLPTRSPPAIRAIPPVSPSALQVSTKERHLGTSAFKRGDYALAATHYTSALSPLPQTHPLIIVLLTNRALAHLKTGDPKSSIADTTKVLTLIGPSLGASETIDLGTEGLKDINAFWAKAMTRQAEALEQLERWADAASVWRTCVRTGVGGATSIAGRNRCEKAAAGPSAAQPPSISSRAPQKPSPKPVQKISALDALSGHPLTSQPVPLNAQSIEAVSRLRAANAEAERVDDEKFALSDKVDERVKMWRKGKEGNLRALLASLEGVLWEGSGWKKVGMGELIVAGRVKVVYMRGIGRVHPDKLPPTATTEQNMISAAVFATLNEAWEGFKRGNNL